MSQTHTHMLGRVGGDGSIGKEVVIRGGWKSTTLGIKGSKIYVKLCPNRCDSVLLV